MAVLIDPPLWPAHGRLWSHLVSDRSLEELHAFARAAGVPERGFEGDHYDVPEERYGQVVAAGAQPVGPRELLFRLQRSGLRRPKRRGERVLTSAEVAGGRSRLDTVRSPLMPPGPATALSLVVCAGTDVLIDVSAGGLPRLDPATEDLAAAADFASDVLGSGLEVEWRRVGYIRSVPLREPAAAPATESALESAFESAFESATRYESVLAARLAPVDAGIGTRTPAGHQWRPEREAVRASRPELAPLVELALGQES